MHESWPTNQSIEQQKIAEIDRIWAHTLATYLTPARALEIRSGGGFLHTHTLSPHNAITEQALGMSMRNAEELALYKLIESIIIALRKARGNNTIISVDDVAKTLNCGSLRVDNTILRQRLTIWGTKDARKNVSLYIEDAYSNLLKRYNITRTVFVKDDPQSIFNSPKKIQRNKARIRLREVRAKQIIDYVTEHPAASALTISSATNIPLDWVQRTVRGLRKSGKMLPKQKNPRDKNLPTIETENQKQRRLKLINILQDNPLTPLSAIAERLSVTIPTIRNDLRAMGYNIKNRQDHRKNAQNNTGENTEPK